MLLYSYITVAHRMQISLTARQYDVLNEEATRTGLSIAELVRRAVDRIYRPDVLTPVDGIEVSFGIWRRPDAAVAGRRPGIRLTD